MLMHVLSSEPKEHKQFFRDRRPAGSVTDGTQVLRAQLYVAFLWFPGGIPRVFLTPTAL